jgi:hypothetical protein
MTTRRRERLDLIYINRVHRSRKRLAPPGVYLDRKCRPMTLEAWTAAFEYSEGRRIGDTRIEFVRVSTVWLGIDHSFGHGHRPRIFETMAFADQDWGGVLKLQWRYTYEREARIGHKIACRYVRAHLQQAAEIAELAAFEATYERMRPPP